MISITEKLKEVLENEGDVQLKYVDGSIETVTPVDIDTTTDGGCLLCTCEQTDEATDVTTKYEQTVRLSYIVMVIV